MISAHPPHPEGAAAPHASAVWLDMCEPDEGEIKLVEAVTGLQLPTKEELGDIERSARLSFDEGVLRLTTPMIAQAATDHPTLTHIGLVMTEQLLISIRYQPLKMFDALAEAYTAQAPPSSREAFVRLLEAFVGRQADLLQEARARLDAISHRVFRHSSDDPRRAQRSSVRMRERLQMLGRVGERISLIRESLLSVERMIPFALEGTKHWWASELADRLRAVRQDIEALSQFEEHLTEKVQFLLDAALGFISIEQNDIFKVLTIASVVGIFPTLVAGWYGMNFHNMPEYGWAYGYQFGIGVIVLSTVLPLLWFKWRGWF
jgi:magnesium transporter